MISKKTIGESNFKSQLFGDNKLSLPHAIGVLQMEFPSIVCRRFFILWRKIAICRLQIYYAIRLCEFEIHMGKCVIEYRAAFLAFRCSSFRNVLLVATPLTACHRAGYSLCDLNWTVQLLPYSHFQSTIRINTMETRN